MISIITTSYNSSNTISDCIISINKQLFPDIEHIFIDGASNDDTINIIKLKSNRKCKIINEIDKGIYDAFNKGIKIASGNIVGFVHSDDFLNNNEVIKKISDYFTYYDCDCLYSDIEYINKYNNNKRIRYWKSGSFERKKLRTGWMPPHPTFYCKKEVYEKYGLYNLDYKICADYEFMLRILKNKNIKCCYLPELTYSMRVGGKSNNSIKNSFRKFKEDYMAVRNNNIGNIDTVILKKLRKLQQFL